MKTKRGSNQHKRKYRDHWKVNTLALLVLWILVICGAFVYYGFRIKNVNAQESPELIPQTTPTPTVKILQIIDEAPITYATPTPIIKFEDPRANKLYSFLLEKGSPLADFSDALVKKAKIQALEEGLSFSQFVNKLIVFYQTSVEEAKLWPYALYLYEY